jgi:hypothetical protein
VDGEAAPPAADVQQADPGFQLELVRDQVELAVLGLLDRLRTA